MSLEFFVKEYPSHVRMIIELDTVKIPHLAFVPVGRFPYTANRIYSAVILADGNFYTKTPVVFQREQVIDHFKTLILAVHVIHRSEIHQEIEVEFRVIAQEREELEFASLFNRKRLIATEIMRVDDDASEFGFNPVDEIRTHIFLETTKWFLLALRLAGRAVIPIPDRHASKHREDRHQE